MFNKQMGRDPTGPNSKSSAVKKISTDEMNGFVSRAEFLELQKFVEQQLRLAMAEKDKQIATLTSEKDELTVQITSVAEAYGQLQGAFSDLQKEVDTLKSIQNSLQFKLQQKEESCMERSMQNSVHGPMPAGAAAAPAISEYASALAAPGTPCSGMAGRAPGTYAAAVGGAAAKATPPAPKATLQQTQPSAEAQDRMIVLTIPDNEQLAKLPGAKLALAVRTQLRDNTGDPSMQVAEARVLQPRKSGDRAAAGAQPPNRVTVVVTLQTTADVQSVRDAAMGGKLKPWSVRPWRAQEQQQLFVKLMKAHSQGLAKARAEKRAWRVNRNYTKLEVREGDKWSTMQPDAEHAAGGGVGGVAAATAAGPGEGQQ